MTFKKRSGYSLARCIVALLVFLLALGASGASAYVIDPAITSVTVTQWDDDGDVAPGLHTALMTDTVSEITLGANITWGSGASVTRNNALVIKSDGTVRTLSMTNNGAKLTSNSDVNFNNINVTASVSGALTVGAAGSIGFNTGAFDLRDGALVNTTGGSVAFNTATINASGNGAITVTNSNASFISTTIDASGTGAIALSGGNGKNISIDGGSIAVTGADSTGAIDFKTGPITLSNITSISSAAHGGITISGATVTKTTGTTTITGPDAYDDNGAIYVQRGSLTFDGATLVNNAITNESTLTMTGVSVSGQGSATPAPGTPKTVITSTRGTATITGTFTNNFGTVDTPVIKLTGGTASIRNGSSITNNDGTVFGINGATVDLTTGTSNNNFSGNKGERTIDLNGGILNIATSNIKNNSADPIINVTTGSLNVDTTSQNGVTTFEDNEGTSVVNAGIANFMRTVFQNNTTSASVIETRNSMTFTNGSITGNTPADQVVLVDGGSANFSGTTVANNGTTGATNGIIVARNSARVDFNNNAMIGSDQTTSGNKKRALVLEGGATGELNVVTFKNNSPLGAIQVKANSTLNLRQATLDSNDASNDPVGGGAILVEQDGRLNFVTGATGEKKFTNNKALNGGAIYYTSGSNTKIFSIQESLNVLFEGNNATERGGAVYQKNGVTAGGSEISGGVHFYNGTTFNANFCPNGGGAIYAEGTDSNAVAIAGTEFTGNYTTAANGHGGAIWSNGQMSVTSGNFANNYTGARDTYTMVARGGAIYVEAKEVKPAAIGDPDYVITIGGGTFTNNVASSGGAVYALMGTTAPGGTQGGRVSVSGNTTFGGAGNEGNKYINGNKATGTATNEGVGGAIWCGGIQGPSSGQAIFLYNTAVDSGGGVYTGTTARGFVQRMIFEGNAAGNGGGVYADYLLTARESIFYANITTVQNGAGMLLTKESLVENCSFVANATTTNGLGFGGGIYLPQDASKIVIRNSYFRENEASNGAAICNGGSGSDSPVLAVHRCFFTGNKVSNGTGQGGAIKAEGSIFLLLQSTFEGNTAEGTSPQGGALYCDSEIYRIVNSTFYNNSLPSSGEGGAIYIGSKAGSNENDPNSGMYFSTVASNSAGDTGGGVIVKAHQFKFGGNILISNIATYGSDLFRSDVDILTRGYNFIGSYGSQTGSRKNASINIGEDNNYREPAQKANDKQSSSYTTSLIFVSPLGLGDYTAENTPNYAGAASITYANAGYVRSAVTMLKLRDNDGTSVQSNPARGAISATTGRTLYSTYAFYGGTGSNSPFSTSDLPGYQSTNVIDERNVIRGENGNLVDAGAYQYKTPATPPPGPDGDIHHIQIGGITNSSMAAGQIVTLSVTAFDASYNRINRIISYNWGSMNPTVAAIDRLGNLTSLTPGSTYITARVASNMEIFDSQPVTVRYGNSYTNIASSIWSQWMTNIQPMENTNMFIADEGPDRLRAFASYFRNAYGVEATQVSDLREDKYGLTMTSGLYNGSSTPVRKSTKIALDSQVAGGSVIPMAYTYLFTEDEVSKLLTETSQARSASDTEIGANLFNALNISFTGEDGKTIILIGRGGAIDYATAINSGALQWRHIGETYRLDLTAYIADATSTTGQANLWSRYLVVADNEMNGRIDGTLHLLNTVKPQSGGGSGGGGGGGSAGGEGGGGGGGCSAGALALFALIPAIIKRRR